MGTLIIPSALLTVTDDTARLARQIIAGVDPCGPLATQILSDVDTAFAANIPQRREWETYALPLTAHAPAASGVGFAGLTGTAGSFGGGNPPLSRPLLLAAALYSWIDGGIRARIRAHAQQDGITQISDLASYAAYYNNPANSGGAAYSVLFAADFAAAYWYAYGAGSRQLPPACVFAPAGILVGTGTITAANAITLANNAVSALPVANGYTSPAPGTDAYGNSVYVGGGNETYPYVPVAQGFAPVKAIEAVVTTAINGTATVTLTVNNQAGTPEAFTATLSNAAVGTIVQFTPAMAQARAAAPPTAATVAGTATAGEFNIVTVAERAV